MFKYKKNKILKLVLFLQIFLITAEANSRDFHSIEERPVKETAFLMKPDQWRMDAGLFGGNLNDVGGTLGFSYTPNKVMGIGFNLAHIGVGLFNINTKYSLIDKGNWGVAFGLDFLWLHGSWFWIADDSVQKRVSGVEAFFFPLQLITSVEPGDRTHFDFAVEYLHGEILGDYNGDNLVYDGSLGERRFEFKTTFRFFATNRISLNINFKLPVYHWQFTEFASEIELDEGLIGGIRHKGYKGEILLKNWTLTPGVETEIHKLVYLTVQMSIGSFAEDVYGRRINLSTSLEWRF